MELSEVVEIVEVRFKLANEYLEHGYHLIRVETTATPRPGPEGKTLVMLKRFSYVLGRTADVDPWKPEEKEAKPE